MTRSSSRTKAASISGAAASASLTANDIAAVDGVETVGPEAVSELAAITADAFSEDPFSNWLHRHQKYRQEVFAILARYVYAPRGFCQIYREGGQGKGLAAAMWMLPGGSFEEPLRGRVALATALWKDGRTAAVRRGLAAGKAMASHHPKEPHAYLFTVGVASAGRGRGLGRRLIEPVLDACDATGTMAYLENSNPANQRFYQSLGFESVTIFHPLPGSEPLEAMRRDPR